MLKNYFKIALRNLVKDRVYTFINLVGLSVGLGVCLVIFIFLQFHLGFDRFHKNADRIYRIATIQEQAGEIQRSGNMQGPLAQTLIDEIPEVEDAVRFKGKGKVLVTTGENAFYDSEVLQTDPAFFRIFNFPFVQGDPETALTEKNSLVLSSEAARKYFGDQNPIGQEMIFDEDEHFIVTGVLEKVPEQSHLHFSTLINIPDSVYGVDINTWNRLDAFYTYLLLQENVEPNRVLAKVPEVLSGKISDETLERSDFYLQPLKDIHLKSELSWELIPKRIFSANYMYIFGIVGIFILLIACVNYINLSTARATNRLKEVGVRKAAGAQRSNLFWQFTGEILILTFLAAVLAAGLSEILLPFVNDLMELRLSSHILRTPYFLSVYVIVVFLIGLLSSIYPALVLSSFNPSDVLRGNSITLSGGGVRKGLVVFQFAISMVLVISTFVIKGQLGHFQNMNLGLNPEQVLNISLESSGAQRAGHPFSEKLSQISSIQSVTVSSGIPGTGGFRLYLYPERDSKEPLPVSYNKVDSQYLKTLDMELLAGRNFRKTDTELESVPTIVNEATIREMGWKADEAIDKFLDRFQVIGVVKDFHYESFEHEIRPAIMVPLGSNDPQFISVLIGTANISAAMDQIKQEWELVAGSYPFQYSFMDDTFESLYRSEIRLGTLFTVFAVITIIIACLGLFGLVAFMASKRTKEIGIRKVLGASVAQIVGTLSMNFIKLVIVGFIIAIPISWYAMNQWLQNFAYRIEIGTGIFALAGATALLIALITVSGQSLKAALMDPVDSLRNE